MTEPDPKAQAVEVAAQRLAVRTPPNKHGQLCPIWTRREKNPPITACDCWVLADARTDARIVVLVVWYSAEDAALERVEADIRESERTASIVGATTSNFDFCVRLVAALRKSLPLEYTCLTCDERMVPAGTSNVVCPSCGGTALVMAPLRDLR